MPGIGCGDTAAGGDLAGIRRAEAEQAGDDAERLGQADEGALAKDGRFPDEAVLPGRHQRQQPQQRRAHRQQPEAVGAAAEQPAAQAALFEQAEQRRRQVRRAGIARQQATEPQPQPAQRTVAVAGEDEAGEPAEQGQQVQPEQAAQRPEHIDRPHAIAKGRVRQPGADEQGQRREQVARQPRALLPVPQRLVQPVAPGQPEGPGFDQVGRIAALLAGVAVGFAVFQRAGVLFAQAHGLGEPQTVEGR